MYVAQPIAWTDRGVIMLDQRRLPAEEISHTYTDYREVAKAIRKMVIRGAPAIGVAAAMGAALGVLHSRAKSVEALRAEFAEICETLEKTRPTAVDLFWALERMKRHFAKLTAETSNLGKIREGMVEEAKQVHFEKKATDEAIGRFGAEFMPREGQVMTQCNAGALATAGIGSALGVIRVAFEQGRKLHVLVPETRPYLQGARLTAWELHKGGIPLTLITDNMVGHFLKSGKVAAVVTGADRIAANGDTPRSISPSPTGTTSRSKSAPLPKSRISRASVSPPTFTPPIPPSTSPPPATSPPSLPNAASPAPRTKTRSAHLLSLSRRTLFRMASAVPTR